MESVKLIQGQPSLPSIIYTFLYSFPPPIGYPDFFTSEEECRINWRLRLHTYLLLFFFFFLRVIVSLPNRVLPQLLAMLLARLTSPSSSPDSLSPWLCMMREA